MEILKRVLVQQLKADWQKPFKEGTTDKGVPWKMYGAGIRVNEKWTNIVAFNKPDEIRDIAQNVKENELNDLFFYQETRKNKEDGTELLEWRFRLPTYAEKEIMQIKEKMDVMIDTIKTLAELIKGETPNG